MAWARLNFIDSLINIIDFIFMKVNIHFVDIEGERRGVSPPWV
jgi:hypothetical protein